MHSTILTLYVLMWPVLVSVVLFIISRGFIREWRAARMRGEDII